MEKMMDAASLEIKDRVELEEMHAWAKAMKRKALSGTKSFNTVELGGHMEPRKVSDTQMIGPSCEEVQNLLESCSRNLGMNYASK